MKCLAEFQVGKLLFDLEDVYKQTANMTVACVISILGNTSRTSKCFKTVCPAVEAKICVKVKPKNNTQIRYVMMSKCELKQIYCLNDVKTTIVPVKLCKATSLRGGASRDEDSDVSEIQAQISELNKSEFGPVKDTQLNQEDMTTLSDGEAQTDEPQNKEEDHIENTEENVLGPSQTSELAGGSEAPLEVSTVEQVEDAEETVSEPSQTSVLADSSEPPPDAKTDGQVENADENVLEPLQTSVFADSSESTVDTTTDEPLSKEETHAEDVDSTVTATEPQADDKDGREKQILNNAGQADNGGECPQKCPTGDVMVCARCSHRVYRTFMSVCYMRMYQCQNPKEKLELVSRHACQGSAPYLGDMSRPSNNLVEPQDNDPVLDYIFAAQDNGHPKF